MRPKSIVWFEAIYLLSVGIGFAVSFSVSRIASTFDPIVTAIAATLVLVLPVTFALLVSRRRSRAALALLLLLTWLIGASYFGTLYWISAPSPVFIASLALQAVAMAATLLPFTPSARAWLKSPRPRPVAPETLGRTFE